MLYWTEVAVCAQINTKQTECGQKCQFLSFKPVGASNPQALKG
jgi:hypothetical protein